MRKLFLWFIFFCSILSSCEYSNEYQTINVENEFSITLPPWLKQEKDLKRGAALQYANRFRNFYVIGESFNKSELVKTIPEMMNDNLNVIRASMKEAQVTDSIAVSEGQLPGIRTEIYGRMEDENIYFSEVLLEGKSKIYHISIWTRNEERKLRFKQDISKIIHSVKEL